MWVKSYSKVYPGISKDAVWRLWEDVNNWPKWDKELEYCKFEGKFIPGNKFLLKPVGGPKVTVTLQEVTPYKSFTDFTKFPGATMYDVHTLEETTQGLKVSHSVKVEGWLSFLWVKLVAKNVAASVPKQLDALVELAN